MAGISDRALQFGKYNRYRYNGIELDTSLGLDDYEAPLRILDPQVGRWWGLDSKSDDDKNDMLRWSPYTSNKDNPILLKDPKGDCPTCLIGAAIGAAVDITVQVTKNLADGNDLGASFKKIDWTEVGVATVAGAATGGISSFYETATVQGTKTLITEGVAQTMNVAGASVTMQASTGDGNVSAGRVLFDMATDKFLGSLSESLAPKSDATALSRQVDRTSRIAANDPTSSGRAANAAQAKSDLSAVKTGDFAKQSAVSTTMFGASGVAADASKGAAKLSTPTTPIPDSRSSQDATANKIFIPLP